MRRRFCFQVLLTTNLFIYIRTDALTNVGINTLIMNLLTSFADDDEDEAAGKIKSETENVDEDETGTWVGEYQRGCDWEIYSTTLADMFEGVQFAALSEVLYQKLGSLLFTQSLTHSLSYLLTYSLTYRYCPICITSRRFEERQRKLPCVLKSRPICNPGK